MGAYVAGGTGSDNTHTPQMMSGGKKNVAAKSNPGKSVAKKVAAKKAVVTKKAVRKSAVKSARMGRAAAATTPRMRGMVKEAPGTENAGN